VFDQGVTYLNLLLENKGEIRSEYNDSIRQGYLKAGDVKWQHSKIIFVAPSFTETQLGAADFWSSLPLGSEFAIELWEVKQYENGLINLNPVKQSVPAPREENYVPSESRLLDGKPGYTIQLYRSLKKAVFSIEKGITIRPKTLDIGFILKDKTFMNISIHRGYIKLWLNVKHGMLKDPRKLTRDVSKLRHWGSGDYEIRLRDTKNLEYVIGLVKQSTLTPNPSPPRKKKRGL